MGAVAGVALLIGAGALAPWHATAAAVATAPRDLTIASPQPYFMQLGGQGPAFAGNRIVWTAINPQGQAGSQADRIYAYDLVHRRLSVPVRSQFGAAGFIGGYALAGNKLAYVDTGLTRGGLLSWRVAIVDLDTHDAQTIAGSPPGGGSHIAPQIAYDGAHLLILQTLDLGALGHESVATLFTPAQHRQQVLERARGLVFGDPTLAHNAVLWTTINFSPHASSHLTLYVMTRHMLHTLAVGDVSQLAASGDLVVWKSGMSGVNGHIGLYSVQSNRVLVADVAHSNRAVYPATDGRLVAWTYDDGSRVQIYSLGSSRVIYSAPIVRNRFYGLTAMSDHSVAWAYTIIQTDAHRARGYIVVHEIG